MASDRPTSKLLRWLLPPVGLLAGFAPYSAISQFGHSATLSAAEVGPQLAMELATDPQGDFIARVKQALGQDRSSLSIPDLPAKSLHTVKIGQFQLPTTVPRNNSVTVRYAVPLQDDGQAPVASPFWVVYCPYPKEDGFADGRNFREIAERIGLPVFGMLFTGMTERDVAGNDRSGSYYYPESGSLTAVRDAAEQLREQFHLDKPPILVSFGESGGGSWSQNLHQADPLLIRAAISLGGRHLPSAGAQGAIAFLASTLGDAAELVDANDRLAASIASHGDHSLRIRSPPVWNLRGGNSALFHHCPDDDIKRVALTYLGGLAALVEKQGHFPHTLQDWPLACQTDSPSLPFAPTQTSSPDPSPILFPSRGSWQGFASLPGETLHWLGDRPTGKTAYSYYRCHGGSPARPPLTVAACRHRILMNEFETDLLYLADRGFNVLAMASEDGLIPGPRDPVFSQLGFQNAAVILYRPVPDEIAAWLDHSSAHIQCLGVDGDDMSACAKLFTRSDASRLTMVTTTDDLADAGLMQAVGSGAIPASRVRTASTNQRGQSAAYSERIRLAAEQLEHL